MTRLIVRETKYQFKASVEKNIFVPSKTPTMRKVLSLTPNGEIHLDDDVRHREITGDKLTINTKKGPHNSTGYPTFFTDDRNWIRGNTNFADDVEIAGSTKVQGNLAVGGRGTQLDANGGNPGSLVTSASRGKCTTLS